MRREAKISCPHCGGKITVRQMVQNVDSNKSAAFWKEFDLVFRQMDVAFKKLGEAFKRAT